MTCFVSYQIDQHLDRLAAEEAADMRTSERAEEIKAELMAEGAEFDPLSIDGLVNGLGDADDAEIELIGAMLRAQRYDAAGLLLFQMAFKAANAVASEAALKQAEKEEAETCQRCHGGGCPNCDPAFYSD